jgi:MoaD family protein
MIHIHFYANMRTFTEQATLDIPLSSAKTLGELLDRLITLFPGMDHNLMDDHGELRPDVPIFVNGRNPRLNPAGIHLPLKSDDMISLFSPISSGRMNVEGMRRPSLDENR